MTFDQIYGNIKNPSQKDDHIEHDLGVTMMKNISIVLIEKKDMETLDNSNKIDSQLNESMLSSQSKCVIVSGGDRNDNIGTNDIMLDHHKEINQIVVKIAPRAEMGTIQIHK